MKSTTSRRKKYGKKSPIVAVIAEQHKDTPPAQPQSEVLTATHKEESAPQAQTTHQKKAGGKVTKEAFSRTTKLLIEQLGEPKEKRGQLWAIVRRLGEEETLRLLQETQEIEACGGMMTRDGERRRTTGGVFFYLTKKRHPDFRFLLYRLQKHRQKMKQQSCPSTEE